MTLLEFIDRSPWWSFFALICILQTIGWCIASLSGRRQSVEGGKRGE